MSECTNARCINFDITLTQRLGLQLTANRFAFLFNIPIIVACSMSAGLLAHEFKRARLLCDFFEPFAGIWIRVHEILAFKIRILRQYAVTFRVIYVN